MSDDVCSVNDLFDLYMTAFQEPKPSSESRPGGWIFRGHQDYQWKLESTLERACKMSGVALDQALEIEKQLLTDFRRRYPHYAPDPPREDEIIEWLSLMRHYGSPGRFMDWTYSFFVAAFFAVENALGDSAIFALDSTWLHENIRGRLEPHLAGAIDQLLTHRDSRSFDFLFCRGHLFIYPINPFKLSERHSIQQGVFLCPGEPGHPFEKNLEALNLPSGVLRKIRIRRECRHEILLTLHAMNVNSAALFPGLDGFARSLNTKMLILLKRPSQTVKSDPWRL